MCHHRAVTTRSILPRRAEGIELRRLMPSDLQAFQSYRQDAEIGRFQGWQAMSDGAALAFLTEMNSAVLLQRGQWTQIAIAQPGSATLIGDIGLFVADDAAQAEIGFTLGRAAQGRGLGSAAVRAAIALLFEQTPVQQVIAITDARNTPSMRLLERVGMTRLQTQAAVFRGEPCLEHHYRLTRAEQRV